MAPDVLHHAQSAPTELATGATIGKIPFISKQESAEQWLKYEHLFYSCLITGDDKSASLCLERLEQRFGASNEKVKGLRGIYNEASADPRKAEDVLRAYEKELGATTANIPLAKRRIALLRGLGKDVEAITALNTLLEISPTDIEAWSELAEIYIHLKLHSQALYCLGEVLLVQPNAWNVHARCGEVSLMSNPANEDKQVTADRLLNALHHYSRSNELCKDYVRGLCGLKQTTSRILDLQEANPGLFDEKPLKATHILQQQANVKLQRIVRAYPADSTAPGILAAKLLLD